MRTTYHYLSLSVNLALFLDSAWGAYSSMDPARLARTNPDVIYCVVCLLGSASVSTIGAYIGINYFNVGTIQRPSLWRLPLRLWADPLQFITLGSALSWAMLFGSSVGLLKSNSVIALWTVASYFAIALGLSISLMIVYRLFASKIERRR